MPEIEDKNLLEIVHDYNDFRKAKGELTIRYNEKTLKADIEKIKEISHDYGDYTEEDWDIIYKKCVDEKFSGILTDFLVQFSHTHPKVFEGIQTMCNNKNILLSTFIQTNPELLNKDNIEPIVEKIWKENLIEYFAFIVFKTQDSPECEQEEYLSNNAVNALMDAYQNRLEKLAYFPLQFTRNNEFAFKYAEKHGDKETAMFRIANNQKLLDSVRYMAFDNGISDIENIHRKPIEIAEDIYHSATETIFEIQDTSDDALNAKEYASKQLISMIRNNELSMPMKIDLSNRFCQQVKENPVLKNRPLSNLQSALIENASNGNLLCNIFDNSVQPYVFIALSKNRFMSNIQAYKVVEHIIKDMKYGGYYPKRTITTALSSLASKYKLSSKSCREMFELKNPTLTKMMMLSENILSERIADIPEVPQDYLIFKSKIEKDFKKEEQKFVLDLLKLSIIENAQFYQSGFLDVVKENVLPLQYETKIELTKDLADRIHNFCEEIKQERIDRQIKEIDRFDKFIQEQVAITTAFQNMKEFYFLDVWNKDMKNLKDSYYFSLSKCCYCVNQLLEILKTANEDIVKKFKNDLFSSIDECSNHVERFMNLDFFANAYVEIKEMELNRDITNKEQEIL